MATIYYDYNELRQAVVMLLDPFHGDKWSQMVKEAIMRLPKKRKFIRYQARLNVLVTLAEAMPAQVLRLIERVDEERKKIKTERELDDSYAESLRKRVAETARRHYQRGRLIVETEELKTGKPMTTVEQAAFIKKYRGDVAKRRQRFVLAHRGDMAYYDAVREFSDILDKEAQAAYEKAKAEAEASKK